MSIKHDITLSIAALLIGTNLSIISLYQLYIVTANINLLMHSSYSRSLQQSSTKGEQAYENTITAGSVPSCPPFSLINIMLFLY